jgi:beta-lactamase regulating signal transducer with metallopeptidase domain
MTVQSIKVTDGHQNVSNYSYEDHSGNYQSINATTGQSDAYKIINKLSTGQKVTNAYMGLSTAAKIGVACGVVGGILLLILAFFIFFCVQRRKGAKMAKLENKEWDEQQNELMEYRQRMAKGQFAVSQMGHGERY